ncbi:homing endonuclease associated repeat-containing protein [Nocardioides sp. MH1]|uniref:homing endonuclease associated repeat-containing protein n=1 Tax=Nocardioides sp. MH1 TaxID=3242490 RepID=UPI0035202423
MARPQEFTDRQLAAAVAAASAELGEPLTVGAYDAWQRGRDDAASPALLVRRFGSWKQACAAAGVATNATRSTSRRWSDDDVARIVARYLRSPGSTGSFADYSAWARDQADVPSGATLRQRHPWAQIKDRALALPAE